MDSNIRKQVIDIDATEVSDETLARLKAELRDQHDETISEIVTVETLVIDAKPDSGLDSHATIYTETNTNE
jgi:hypothetical protein